MIPVFIGGTGRSGTTILKKILAQHSKIRTLPQELRLIVDPGGALDLAAAMSDRWSPFGADHAIHEFESLVRECTGGSTGARVLRKLLTTAGVSPPRYRHLSPEALGGRAHIQECLNRLTAGLIRGRSAGRWIGSPPWRTPGVIFEAGPLSQAAIALRIGEFFEQLYALPGRPEVTHWLDDTPYSILHAADLLRLFPSMRLLHIYRDPRDVVASYRTKSWGGDDIELIAHRISAVLAKWQGVKEELPGVAFKEIALEELVRTPRQTLERICSYLALAYEEPLERIRLDAANSGRWRKDLTPAEKDKVLPILEAAQAQFGYR